MPQMAPALYLQLFMSIVVCMLLLKANIYFSMNKPFTTLAMKPNSLMTSWLW